MKTIRKWKWMLVLVLLGWASMAQAQYSGAPTLSTTGSAAYTPIATAINGWRTAYAPPANASSTNSAFAHRSAIIDQGEATLLAAGKDLITDNEYDILADALCFWLSKVSQEGLPTTHNPAGVYNNNRGGWYINSIDIGAEGSFFGKQAAADYNNSQCVWELVNTDVLISQAGAILGSGTRLVLFTNKDHSRIYRSTNASHHPGNVMFSTNGENSKLLILGRRNHTIQIDGGQGWSDPTSYDDVKNRTYTNSKGSEVVVKDGAVLAGYTTFMNNSTTAGKNKYRYCPSSGVNDTIYCGSGGAISLGGTFYKITETNTFKLNTHVLKACAFYKTTIKNNHLGEYGYGDGTNFGGGIGLYQITNMTQGIWINKCEFIGNRTTSGHGGGLGLLLDGGDPNEENDKIVVKSTNFTYNCQTSTAEKHGGGMFHRDTNRKVQMYGCNFTYNFANGLTAGGAGISTEGHLLLDNCVVENNMAENSFGGGIYARPYSINANNKLLNLEIKGGRIKNNTCTWTGDLNSLEDLNRGSGGGVYVSLHRLESDPDEYTYTVNLLVQDNCEIANNHADRCGGGIILASSYVMEQYLDEGGIIESDLEINSAIIHDNTTGKSGAAWTPEGSRHDDGGAVYLSYSNLRVTGTENQVKVYDNTALKNGGAFCIHKGNIKIEGGRLGMEGHPNHAVLGGGFYVFQGSVTMNNGLIGFNQASTNGGGGYVDAGGSVLMEGGEIHDNTAINGGGMFVNGGSFTLDGGYIHGNDATTHGGGVYMNGGNFYHYRGEVGKSYDNPNTAVNGAGVYMDGGNYTMTAGYINGNAATTDGGGVYMNSGDFNMKGGTIGWGATSLRNTAVDGAGVYMHGGEFTMKSGYMRGNYASRNGGGVYSAGGTIDVKGGFIGQSNNSHNEAVNGGGIYSAGGVVTLDNDSTAVHVNYNAATNGGGIYTTNGGSIQIDKTIGSRVVEIKGNSATNWGGGVYAGGTITINGGNVQNNTCNERGGGIYVADGGLFNLTGGYVGGTTADGNSANGANGAGGGLYMAGGTANISGGAISGNNATMNGGGVFMFGESARCTLSNNAIIGGDRNADNPSGYANTAEYGAGIYSAGGIITVKGGSIAYNHAGLDGGGIYSAGSQAKVYILEEGSEESYVDHNTADRNGGGVFASLGEVHFSNGNVQHNFAENAGGGMYVDKNELGYGELFLTGNAKLDRNHVPSGMKGGGVYLRGKVTVGAPGEQSSVTAENNFAFTTTSPETYDCNDETRNNIYLPEPMVRDDHTGLITVVKGCINTTSKVGFSVPQNHVPVIYCEYSEADTPNTGDPSSYDYLNGFTTGDGHLFQYVLFEDSHRYISVHYTMYPPSVFHPDHVYLYGFWPEAVTSEPDGFDPSIVRDERDLAWLISVVNGRYDENHQVILVPNDLDGVTVTLQKDLDMKEFGWVPIGMHTLVDTLPTIVNRPFRGTFDGNGHTIEGVNGMVYGYHNAFGLFGFADNAEIENVFVKNSEYFIEDNNRHVIGGLVGIADGNSVIRNSEVSSHIVADNAGIVIGGLAGKLHSGTVHSAIAIPDMEGGIMGGLVGELDAGCDLLNSFANARFTTRSDAGAKFQGGLAAVNSGRIENCYYHEQTGSSHSALFGTLAGDNTNGTVNYSYAASEPYTASAEVAGILSGHGSYADNTEVPYLYRRRDNQVTLAAGQTNPYKPVALPGQNPLTSGNIDEQMLHYLNNWVDYNSGTTEYTRWSRPTTKVVNDDLPLLMMPAGNAVAATTGDPYLEYGSVNTRIAKFKSSLQAIYMYRTQNDSVRGNDDSSAELYIDEHVALIQAGDLQAHVGVTLDNSAGINGAQPTFGGTIEGTSATDYTDWHMFATPLNFPPLGIKYVKADGSTPDDTQWHGAMSGYAYYDHAGMPFYQFYDKDFEGDPDVQGYFPSHAYGTSYSNDNSSPVSGGAYYNEWDFYCYYEPEYHWINFKRNGNDHWHENAHEFHIDYKPNGVDVMNEEYLIPGKGYLVATREHNTFLQAKGVLNGDAVAFPVTRSAAYSPGYNLLGNPYQAYLDFERFANANAALWNGDTPSYYILDEDSKDYVAYASQGSTNPARPEQFIHPHQGFMVLLNSGDGGTAQFTPDMRNIDATTGYRDARPAFPLVNLSATEQNGNRTMVTVELGRPDKGGAAVLKDMHVSRGKLYCRYEGDDYEIAFTRPGLTEAAIRFETLEDAEYTMTWDTQNGEFTYLHLVDNLTGADVDCLAESEYRFTSRTSDYKSRFRLVFGYTGIDEPETPEDGQSQFAFMMGGQLVVNGEGTLQMFDISGRQVMSADTHGTQTTLGLPRLAAGVYTMRLTTAGSSKVQKIVIR